MKSFYKLVILALLPLAVFTTQPIMAESPLIPTPINEPTVEELVVKFSKEYQIDGALLLRVARCESSLNPKAVHYNDGGSGKHSVGVMQFQEATFNNWSKILGEELDYHSSYDQVKLASYMWSKNQERQWTCYRTISGI